MSPTDIKAFRKEVEDLVYTFMSLFDGSGKNTESYKESFAAMSDTQFVEFIKQMLANDMKYLGPEIAPFNKKQTPKFEVYQKLSKLVGVDLEEYVALPYMNENTAISAPVITVTKVPVGKLHLKRLQQIVRKKNKVTTSNEVRDQRKGQVIDTDKGGRITDADMFALSAIGAFPVMKEFYGPRADSMKAKESMYKDIANGSRQPRLSDLPNDIEDKVAINTMNYYIMGASLVSDLVSDNYILPITKRDLKHNQINKEKIQS